MIKMYKSRTDIDGSDLRRQNNAIPSELSTRDRMHSYTHKYELWIKFRRFYSCELFLPDPKPHSAKINAILTGTT